MRIRRSPARCLTEHSVVVEQNARSSAEPDRTSRRVERDIADPINGSSKRRLIAKGLRSVIDHHVPHDPDVVHAPVDLEGIVMEVSHIVVVVVDGYGPAVPILFGRILRTIDGSG